MVFSSTTFLFIFLPLVFILYTLIPSRYITCRNLILAVASLVFYAFGEPVYILLMVGSVTFNYVMALIISKNRSSLLTGLTVAANLAVLCNYKYLPWLIALADKYFSLNLSVPDAVIPVGISFYTFQILSYVVDVKTGKTQVQKNYLSLMLYISFFPQLIAGPIVKYGDIAKQLVSRTCTIEKTAVGLRRFILGLSKKVLISNSAAIIAKAAFDSAAPSSALAWSGAVAYCIQLYFDFSGYSDMAVGLAGMFGFSLCENFNYPYSAVSIRDFWKRWHISLTSWFREYLYFPLGGNRRGKLRTVLNRLTVFFLTGLWHGANFTYIVWGMWHGLLMMLEELLGLDRLAEKKALRIPMRIYTLFCVMIGFVVFNSRSIGHSISYVASMFSFSGNPADLYLLLTPYVLFMLALGVIFSAPILPYLKKKLQTSATIFKAVDNLSYLFTFMLLAFSVMSLAADSFNPFIYYIF